MTFRALRNVNIAPGRIGKSLRRLVLLHYDHCRTT
jgi:hypothetical protein